MEESAPKRQKTSPTINVPVGDVQETATDTRPRRPSFASPTKASMSRSNPEILGRRTAQGSQGRTAVEGEQAASDLGVPTSEGNAAEPSAAPAGGDLTGIEQAQPPRSSQPRSSLARAIGGMAKMPRRSINRPSPRPFPPRSQEEEDFIDPFQGRRLRRSPPRGVLPNVEFEEPELPPTPTQAGLSDPTNVNSSPSGIHSSPSKRARRNRILAERIKGSPLKLPPLQPPELMQGPGSPSVGRKSRRSPDNTRSARIQPKVKSHRARKVKEADPLSEKKATRDSLLAEIAGLKKDLETVSKANEGLDTKRQAPQGKIPILGVQNEDGLIDILCQRALTPEKTSSAGPIQDWVEAALNPMSFLPFGLGATSIPLLVPTAEKEEPEKTPVSHYPVPMSAAEELPYLQLFSNLVFKSSISILPQSSPDESGPVLQKHNISITSTPAGLFAAKVELIVNTKKLSIVGLSVPRLEPSATSELGPFISSIIKDGNNSALTRNVSVISWAMGEWVRLATRRARFWCAVESKLGTKEGVAECISQVRAGKRRKRQSSPDDDENEDNDNQITKSQLLPHLGRTSLDLEIPSITEDEDDSGPTVRIQWRIEFDWTGEGRSKMGLLVETPPRCEFIFFKG